MHTPLAQQNAVLFEFSTPAPSSAKLQVSPGSASRSKCISAAWPWKNTTYLKHRVRSSSPAFSGLRCPGTVRRSGRNGLLGRGFQLGAGGCCQQPEESTPQLSRREWAARLDQRPGAGHRPHRPGFSPAIEQ